VERACFLLEETGQRLSCLLNPDSLVVRRVAGVQPRRSIGGRLTGSGLADDPVLFTGGGSTQLELDLLFDTQLGGSTVLATDVQQLTRPLWELAENVAAVDGAPRLRVVRLVWGKSWNVPAVVVAIAERFERFDPSGSPQRSWLRLRLLRVGTPAATGALVAQPAGGFAVPPEGSVPEDQEIIHEVQGGATAADVADQVAGEAGAAAPPPSGERLDLIAARYYGEPSLWRVLAAYNGIADPTRIPPPSTIRIPPLATLRQL
jgi:hypothetical protein